jgi:imidazolonepropionase
LSALQPCYGHVRHRLITREGSLATDPARTGTDPGAGPGGDAPVQSGVLFTPRLVTPTSPAPKRAPDLAHPSVIEDAAIAWRDGIVTYAGPSWALTEAERPPGGVEVHAAGAVVPGFVDCHTHLPFFGWRADEFEARLTGQTYQDVQGRGGGIFRSARLLADASDDDVVAFCLPLAEEMLAHGTTAFEMKSGYGLSVDAELRQLRLARTLAERVPQTVGVTLLACHALPDGWERAAWVETVCRDLSPAAAAEGLADAVDLYVEDIAFTVDDLRRVADAAGASGLRLRAHADQLGPSGSAEVAAHLGARSADHLNNAGPDGVAALGEGSTVAVLLPVSTLFIRAERPPVEDLLAAGAALAVATDFNPGTSPCLSMPEVISVASSLYRLPPLAAVTAATLNAAFVLGLDDRLGSLEPGRRADFVVLDAEDPAMVPYRPGHDPIAQVWLAGRSVGAST